MRPIGRHRIRRGDSTQSYRMLVSTLITHHTYRTDSTQKNRSCLPDLVIQRNLNLTILHICRNTRCKHLTSLFARQFHLIVTKSANVDIISILQNTDFLRCDVAQDTDSKARSRERMTGNQMFGHSQLTPHTTYLILKQPLQRLTKLQVHLLRESTDIMMALDHLTRDIKRLNAVGIDGSLCEPFGIGNLLGLGIKHLHKVATDNLTFLFRICHTCQVGKEFLTGIDAYHIESQHLVVFHHLRKLILAQHTVIHEDTGQVLTNGSIQQDSCNRGVHTTGKTQDYTIRTQLCLQFCYSRIHKRGCTPLLFRTADIHHEILEQLCSLKRVEHLRMELHSPNGLLG